MEVLVRMYTRLLRRGPTSRINRRSNLSRIVLLPPFDQQRNGILGLRHTAQCLGGTFRRRSRHLGRVIIRDHALADIDMVRVQIIRDIAVLACPRLEGLELELRLAHIAVEVVEVAERAGLVASVRVRRVEALVVFDEDEDAMFAGFFDESQVVLE